MIIEGLRRNGVEVIECHEDFWEDTAQKLEGVKGGSGLIKTLYRLLLAYSKLIGKFRHVGHYDALIVGYAGHVDIFLARVLNLFRRKPVIFDAFLSLYDTAVMDRGIVPPDSFKSKLLRLVDTWACRVADAVLLDTRANVDYFVKEFRLPPEKFFAVPVGSFISNPHSSPLPLRGRDRVEVNQDKGRFNVLYFGSYIPLHGVDVILKAAKILQDSPPPLPGGEKREGRREAIFTLVGVGQLLPEMKQLASVLRLKNVYLVDRFVEEEELKRYIQEADACLGIFGQTDKAMRVIPCKVYNCLAMGKPLITSLTPATEGVLTHMGNALLCRPGDPEDLAKAILSLKNDPSLREKIASCGQEYYKNNFSSEAIGKRVKDVICATL